jgi:CIC family chloride channel protein
MRRNVTGRESKVTVCASVSINRSPCRTTGGVLASLSRRFRLKLRRRGIDIDKATPPSLMAQIPVSEAMGALPSALTPDDPLRQLIARFSVEESDTLPIIDRHGRLLGVVDATDVEQAIEEGRNDLTAAGLARPAPKVRADESLEEAVQALAGRDENGVPVLAEPGEQVVGWLTHRRLLNAYRTRLTRGRPAALHSSSASTGLATP